MDTLIVDHRENGIVHVTLNRPEKKNAINRTMWLELLDVFTQYGLNDETRAMILTGAGGDFCAGADLWDPDGPQSHQLDNMSFYSMIGMALHQMPIPTIAKIEGVAAGAGLNIALGCDLTVASNTARFSEIFHRRGLTVDLGGSWLLPRLIGLHRAKELAFFADVVPAAEAERLGLVNRVVEPGELDAFVDAWAERLAEGPPLALQMTKRLLNNSFSMSMSEALQWEGMGQSVAISSKDTRAAFKAFTDKTKVKFEGR